MQGASSGFEGPAGARGGEHFSSSFAFVLAALGSAVGLGNIWRFPYIAGEHGGGAFVLVYLFAVAGIGLPALIATVMIGRRGAASPIAAVRRVALAEGRSGRWAGLGVLLVIGAFLLLALFSVIAAFILDYLGRAASGGLDGLDRAGAEQLFAALKADPARILALHGLFVALSALIVARGVRRGIERAVKLMMPLLFLLMAGLALFAMIAGEGAQALAFLFAPDFSRLGGDGLMLALGQALLSLSVGGAGMLIYGAYLAREASIPKTCAVIAAADTAAALIAGLMIFPIVFAQDMTPAQGPGLIFLTLPIAFGQMTGGSVVAFAFFLLLLIAALTSAISMLEPVVAYLAERFRLARAHAAAVAGLALWLAGLPAALSYNVLADMRPLAALRSFSDYTLFRAMEFGVTSLLLPVSTLLLIIFAGWIVGENMRQSEFGTAGRTYRLWRMAVRYAAPVALISVFLLGIRGQE